MSMAYYLFRWFLFCLYILLVCLRICWFIRFMDFVFVVSDGLFALFLNFRIQGIGRDFRIRSHSLF